MCQVTDCNEWVHEWSNAVGPKEKGKSAESVKKLTNKCKKIKIKTKQKQKKTKNE